MMAHPRDSGATYHPRNVAWPVDVVPPIVDVIQVSMRMHDDKVADPRIAAPGGRMMVAGDASDGVRPISLPGFAEHACIAGSILDIGEPC